MALTRREFLHLSAYLAAGAFGIGTASLSGCTQRPQKLKKTVEKISTCHGCGLACGIILSIRDNRIVSVEGDPDDPVSMGRLCSYGYSIPRNYDSADSGKPVFYHKKPSSLEWEDLPESEAMAQIASRIKETRDETFIDSEDGDTTNRTEGIAVFAGEGLTVEENYLLSKFARLIGITYLSRGSGRSQDPTYAALSSTFGFGAGTNGVADSRNSDVMVIIGSETIESRPVLFRHITEARKRGTKIILIDTAFSRTATAADIFIRIRPGSTLAFLAGIINHSLTYGRYNRSYVAEYTNAHHLLHPNYGFNDGIFSGYSGASSYEKETWTYQLDLKGIPKTDRSLARNDSVFQILKKHYSRYTPEAIFSLTGCASEQFIKAAELITGCSKPERSAAFYYEMGTLASQDIRAVSIIQLLLGNMGIAGGGIVPVSRAADPLSGYFHGISPERLPGNIEAPKASLDEEFDDYIRNYSHTSNDPSASNMRKNKTSQLVSLLKAWYGGSADKQNFFRFGWLPKLPISGMDRSKFLLKNANKRCGAILIGSGLMTGSLEDISFLKSLAWIIVSDENEAVARDFFKKIFADTAGGPEVFILPSVSYFEKDGSRTNSDRIVRWNNRALKPDGSSYLEIIDIVFKKISDLYRKNGGKLPDPIIKASWDYAGSENMALAVAREISGINVGTGKPLSSSEDIQDDGSTLCGNWIFAGSLGEGKNRMAGRSSDDVKSGIGLYPGWGWACPDNRRILYNRAGVTHEGAPLNRKKPVVEWDGKRWIGDVPDATWKPAPRTQFIMNSEGVGRIFSSDMTDGPLPEFYEALSSRVKNVLSSRQVSPLDAFNILGSFPYSARIIRSEHVYTEHKLVNDILRQISPAEFCEISPALASARKIKTGDSVRVLSGYGSVLIKALVTERVQGVSLSGYIHEVIALHLSGSNGSIRGDSFAPIYPQNLYLPVDIEKV